MMTPLRHRIVHLAKQGHPPRQIVEIMKKGDDYMPPRTITQNSVKAMLSQERRNDPTIPKFMDKDEEWAKKIIASHQRRRERRLAQLVSPTPDNNHNEFIEALAQERA
jgi:hypothetical protein